MKRPSFFIALCFFPLACKVAGSNHHKNPMRSVYLHQKSYYQTKISNKNDYISIVNVGRSFREKLYLSNGIKVADLQNYLILEGFNPGWGTYRGLLISNQGSYTYSSMETGWNMKAIEADNEEISRATGIDRIIIDKVRMWDTAYINQHNHRLGEHVSDGSVFMATRVQYIDHLHSKIETIAFYEFVR
ncbi:MAG: hypothetical protein J7623_19670 [Chitinophaga sp.]|uniref:hypothetical protein n=1 Tax=Chitinophaga sp. TaxID=1869181 RepID=UPI001B159670|nr:hypothetical protein [Chitinophaga sp.]MBO9730868.1 hypothetical protein [Chitinophaga sp.]